MPVPNDCASQLRVRRHVAGDEAVLELSGEMDVACANLAADEISSIEALNPSRLVVDLTGLDFMDSSGLRVLVVARNRFVAEEVEFALRTKPGQVQRLLALSGLSDEFTLLS